MKINEFFDRIVYLNLDSRPDRRARIEIELRKWNIKATRFSAITNENAQTSFNLSCIAILIDFIASDAKRLLVIEDDCVFTPEFLNLSPTLTDLDSMEWSMIYLGGNLYNFPFMPYSRRLIKLSGVWCTHAVGYTKDAAQKIVDNFDPLGPDIFDNWLAQVFIKTLEPPAYMMSPIVAIQAAGYSDLMKDEVDYTQCWNNTKNRMRKLRR